MSVFSWNCRGVGLPWNVRFLKDNICREKPDFIFLCETIGRKDRLEGIRRQLGYEGMIVVEPQGRSGGLALLWKDSEKGRLISFSQNHIDIEVKMDSSPPWRLTGLYGEPDRSQRRKTWDLLRNLARDSNLPWCVIGDLNNVCSQSDKQGGALYPTWLVEGFNEVLAETGLIDMDLVGHQFTWERGRDTPEWMEVRLDRALTSESWLSMFPLAKLINLEITESDHSPILLIPKKIERNQGGGNSGLKMPGCWNQCVLS